MNILQIDLKKIVEKKSPFLAKRSFFINWLRKVVHENELNEVLRVYGHEQGVSFAAAALEFLKVRVQIEYTVPLDPKGRYVFVANHPLGGLDGVALVKALGEKFPELRFPVNDLLLAIENFQPIFLPVNKLGSQSQSREGAKLLEDACHSQDQQVLMFPAGLVSRKIKGKIVDLPWKKQFVKKAIEHQRDIVPVYIDGRNSNRFYRIANWGKYLRFPLLAMLYLPDEMFKQKDKTIRIVVGKPISCSTLDVRSAQEEADRIKQKVYALA